MKPNKSYNNLNAAKIMQRLPFHRQLNLSQSILVKCIPIWEKWSKHNLTMQSTKTIQLSHFQSDELIIHCENAISATQINQQQESLVHFFQNEGIDELKQITVRIINNWSQPVNSITKNNKKIDESNIAVPSLNKLNQNSLNSIKSVQETTRNEKLSESLKRLLNTIEENQ